MMTPRELWARLRTWGNRDELDAQVVAELDEHLHLLARDHERIWPTEKGQRFLNDLLETFLSGESPKPARRVISICSTGTGRP